MRASVQLYSVREELARDLRGTVERLAERGFEAVEPFGLPDDAEQLGEALAATGLAAPTSHASLLSVDDPERVLAVAAELGIGTVIDPYWDPERWQTEDSVRETADRLNALVPVAQRHGTSVGYHNHGFELSTVIDGRPALELLADHLDPAVALEVDTYWAAVGGVDPAGLLRRLGERARFAHLKDGPVTHDEMDQQPLGRGAMDVPSILHAAPWLELGVIEFDHYEGDTLEGVTESLRYLRAISETEATR